MALVTVDAKHKIKRSTIPGVVPVIGISDNHTDGTWSDNMIYPSELFFNIPDQRLWIGITSGVLELPVSSLNLGNSDLTSTGNRTFDMNSFSLNFLNGSQLKAEMMYPPTLFDPSYEFVGYGSTSSDITFRLGNEIESFATWYGNGKLEHKGDVYLGLGNNRIIHLGAGGSDITTVVGSDSGFYSTAKIQSRLSYIYMGLNGTSGYQTQAYATYGDIGGASQETSFFEDVTSGATLPGFTNFGKVLRAKCTGVADSSYIAHLIEMHTSSTPVNTTVLSIMGRTLISDNKPRTDLAESSALLELSSTTKGFLPPRMTGLQAESITPIPEGLMIYSIDGSGSVITSKGWWGYNGSTWEKLN